MNTKTMSTKERDDLLQALKSRFESNAHRHSGTAWVDVKARLEGGPDALRSLREVEATGGEPDVIDHDKQSGHVTFCDCAAESPASRRSACYDAEGLAARKQNKLANSAVGMATAMGIELLTEQQY